MKDALLATLIQTLDSDILRINHYPVVKNQENQFFYPLDRDLSGGWRYPSFEQLEPGFLTYYVSHTLRPEKNQTAF